MANPFPGMNPFLEDPAVWEEFHLVLIAESMYQLSDRLPLPYIAKIQERVQSISIADEAARMYLPDVALARHKAQTDDTSEAAGGTALMARPVTIPSIDDLEIREGHIEILRLPDYELVTSIEVLSPANKSGEGAGVYRDKRRALVARGVHVVEIDLLSRGARTPLAEPLPPGDYFSMIFRADRRPDVNVYAWGLRDAIPHIAVPLKAPGESVDFDLAQAVQSAFDRGKYDRKLNYQEPYPMMVSAPDKAWIKEILQRPQE